MTRIRIYPYRVGSRSAAALARRLGGLVLRREGSRFRPRPTDTIINWGSSDCPFPTVLNSPRAVATASCKLATFEALTRAPEVNIPRFWTNAEQIPDDAFPIVCRTVLRGHSGAGIVIADNRAALVRAPLYVQYVKKRDEYRIHASAASTISVQRKARREGVEIADQRIRNHANGFVFVRGGVNPPQQVLDMARAAVAAIGLDFGAVDIGWNERAQQATVYEVNTACGLEGQTVEDYVEFFSG